MAEIKLGEEDNELKEALEVANDASTNGSKNGREAARRVLAILIPILARSPDPSIKALAIALGIGSQLFLKKKRRRISKNG